MTYRDDTDSIRAENERLRAEIAEMRSTGVTTRGRSTPMETWEHFAMPVILGGVPITAIAGAATLYDGRVSVSLVVGVVLWWGWAIWRLNKS